jgi:hypothetical protein
MFCVLNEALTNRALRDVVAGDNTRNYVARFKLKGGLSRRA